jgi:serine/threonine protein kinase
MKLTAERALLPRELERYVSDFEDAWALAPCPDICRFLPEADADRWLVLHELIEVDREYRGKRRAPVADYRSVFRAAGASAATIDRWLNSDADFFRELRHDDESQRPPIAASNRFQIIRSHARGGLGEVYLAQDVEVGREVALKEIQQQYADDQLHRERFVREAEVTGRLEHPGIVPVYGLGAYADGRPYYAMRFVRGNSLADAIRDYHSPPGKEQRTATQRNLELRRLLRNFYEVCQAVEYAHGKGVLHRDLKPGNIMLGRHGETLIVDWGLAKVGGVNGHAAEAGTETVTAVPGTQTPTGGDSSAQTAPGSAIGTPSYMSPEQAAGELDSLGPASDVFCLGATLYQILTGRPPYSGKTAAEVQQLALRGEYRPPRSVHSAVPRRLDAICRKAMALQPADRYATARALAEDIEAYLADEPLAALPETFASRLSRWERRRRREIRIALALSIVASIGLSIAVGFINHEKNEKHKALVKEQAALASEQAALGKEQEALTKERAALALARDELTRAEATATLLEGLFQAASPISLGPTGFRGDNELASEVTLKDLVARGEQALSDTVSSDIRPEVRARLLRSLGAVYRDLGELDKGRRLLEESLSLYQGAKAPPAELARAHLELGRCLHMPGDYGVGAEHLRKGIDLFSSQAASAKHRSERLDAQFYLAWCLADADRKDEAKEAFHEVLQAHRELGHSRKDKSVMMAQAGLFAILLSDKPEAEAVAALNAELAVSERLDLRLLVNYGLARVFRQQHQYGLARDAYERLRKEQEELLGPKHFLLGMLLIDYAGMLEESSNYVESERVFREALGILLPAVGAHPKLVEPTKRWGEVLGNLGRYEEAIAAYSNAARMLERLRSPNLSLSLICQQKGADCLCRLGRYREATDLLGSAMSRVDPATEGTAQMAQIIRNTWMTAHYQAGNYESAKKLAQQQLEKPKLNESEAAALTVLVDCAAAEGDEQGILRWMEQLQTLAQSHDPQGGAPHSAWLRLGDREQMMGNNQYWLAEELKHRGGKNDHVVVADMRQGIARSLELLHRLDESLTTWDQVIGTYEQALGTNHPVTARAKGNRAAVLSMLREDQTEAVEELMSARQLVREAENRQWLANVDRALAAALQKAQRPADAAYHSRQARETCRQVLPELHPTCHVVEMEYIRLLQAQRDWNAAAHASEDWLAVLRKRLPAASLRIAEVEQLLALSHAKLSGLDAPPESPAAERLRRSAKILKSYRLWGDDFHDF